MKTVTVLAGNSDDKLPQKQWSAFCRRVTAILKAAAGEIHFAGGSGWDQPWQNACWVARVHELNLPDLRRNLAQAREAYNQDSVAILVGDTEFI